mmetsp:Transcript_26334/g.40749  ORF Transcript_26334/g.40749 Transcript_26334/m.40749 type:complete len:145 (+) Transcript_26334:210-644(+)
MSREVLCTAVDEKRCLSRQKRQQERRRPSVGAASAKVVIGENYCQRTRIRKGAPRFVLRATLSTEYSFQHYGDKPVYRRGTPSLCSAHTNITSKKFFPGYFWCPILLWGVAYAPVTDRFDSSRIDVQSFCTNLETAQLLREEHI